jgi:hypothetical protein
LTDIRNNSRSPKELGLCMIRWLPDNAWAILERKYGSPCKSLAVDEWLEDRQERYAYLGDWLAHWQLGMKEPKGEKAALYSPIATSIHKFMDLCYGISRLSQKYSEFSDDVGGIRLTCNALTSEFFRDMADCGIGKTLMLPGYPDPLIEGKVDEYKRSVRELRSLGCAAGNRTRTTKPKRGRPKGSVVRAYPPECGIFSDVISEAKNIALKDAEFRRKLYEPWLKSKSEMNTFCQSSPMFCVGTVADGRLSLGAKGTKAKK